MDIVNKISSILKEKFSVQHLEIIDESDYHQGHSETKKTPGGHYQIIIVSENFFHKSLIERHRLIHAALKSEFEGNIHALAIKAYTPQEWKKIQ